MYRKLVVKRALLIRLYVTYGSNSIHCMVYLYFADNSTNDEMEPLLLDRRGRKVNNVIVKGTKIIKLPTDIRETCLPKMLCEMSAKSTHQLSDKEKKLLELIRLV